MRQDPPECAELFCAGLWDDSSGKSGHHPGYQAKIPELPGDGEKQGEGTGGEKYQCAAASCKGGGKAKSSSGNRVLSGPDHWRASENIGEPLWSEGTLYKRTGTVVPDVDDSEIFPAHGTLWQDTEMPGGAYASGPFSASSAHPGAGENLQSVQGISTAAASQEAGGNGQPGGAGFWWGKVAGGKGVKKKREASYIWGKSFLPFIPCVPKGSRLFERAECGAFRRGAQGADSECGSVQRDHGGTDSKPGDRSGGAEKGAKPVSSGRAGRISDQWNAVKAYR